MQVRENRARGRFRAMFARGAVAAMLATSLAAWGVASSTGRAMAEDADEAVQSAEPTLEQQLTPLGGNEPSLATGPFKTVDASGADAEDADGADAGELATIVVQLEDNASSALSAQSAPDPLQWLFGGVSANEVDTHEAVRDQIQDLVDDKVEDGLQLLDADGNDVESARIETVAEYRNVIDGFAVKAPQGIVEEIQNLDGVKRAYVDEVYSLPTDQGTQDDAPLNASTLGMTGADKVEWRGEGQVIAIIDSGLQTDHEAFQGDLDDEAVAFTQEQIDAAKAGLANGGANGKYVSEKIVFTYDYADNDDEVTPGTFTDLSHGTHVAGIASANSGDVEGTAPDAQIMMFKVCDDLQGSISNSNLLRAMDDMAALDVAAEEAGGHGIDSMNMSIGSDNGFSERASGTFGDAVQALENRGIVSNIAAGNAYNSAYGNKSGSSLPYATDPDAEIISSPAADLSAVAVASVNSAKGGACFFFDEEAIEYQQLTAKDGSTTAQFADLADGTYELVDGGYGSAEDAFVVSLAYDGSLTGKIVLVQRGSSDGSALTFQAKAENFLEMKPAAIIIYNNVSEITTNFGLSKGLSVPVVGISLEDGGKMASAMEQGVATITTDKNAVSPDASFGNYTMSAFSSWGTTPEMEIKPEISAPGGNVYSAYSGSSTSYGYMSGTSMATPQMAGITAQMTQYLSEDSKFSNVSTNEKRDLVTLLLMSTAKPMDEPGDDASYYSVREQGAGIADVQAATSTPVYLTVEGDAAPENGNRAKAELGESENGEWTFTVKLHNLSDAPASYTPDAHAISDQVEDGLFLQDSRDWTGQGITVAFGGAAYDSTSGKVSVGANSEAEYTITITCESAFTEWAQENTPNGTFVEGFAKLTGDSEGAVDLSLPFLGFYGDWDAVPVFDAGYYDTDNSAHMLGSLVVSGNTGAPLGINPFDSTASYVSDYTDYVDTKKYVVSNTSYSSSPYSLVPMTGVLRNLKNLAYEYKNAAGTTVKTYNKEWVSKSYYLSSYGAVIYPEQLMSPYPSFDGTNEDGRRLPDGIYTLNQTATTAGGNGGTQTGKAVQFSYDTAKPTVSDITYSGDGDERVMHFKVTDDTWLAAVQFYDNANGGFFYRKLVDDENGDGSVTNAERVGEEYTTNEDGSHTWEFEVSVADLKEQWESAAADVENISMPNVVSLYCYDYGLNGSEPVNTAIIPVPPTAISASPEEITLYAGQQATATASFEPENATEIDVEWSSADSTIATVSGTGVVHAVANGDTTITATSAYDSNLTATISVQVTDVPEDVGIAMVSPEVTASYDEEFTVKAVVAPAFANDEISWELDNEDFVSIEDNPTGTTATLKAGKSTGNAVLSASVSHNGQTYTAQMDIKVRVDDYDDFVIDEDYAEGPRLLYYQGHKSEISIPDNVKVIGPQALAGLSVQIVNIPRSVEKIEYQAFTQMGNLAHVYFEEGSNLKEMGDEVFYYTLSLQEITLPEGLKKIGTGTFMTSAAGKIVMPESLHTIPADTFYYSSLYDVTISDHVSYIGDRAFSGNSVGDIKLVGTAEGKDADGELPTGLPSSLVEVGEYGLSGISASELIMPDTLRTIGRGGFSYCTASKIVLNDTLQTIGQSGFAGCTGVKEFTIPDSVTSVGYGAFEGMSQCETFNIGCNIPDGDLEVAFPACYSAKEYVVPEDCANYSAIDGALFNKDATRMITVNEGAMKADVAYTVPATVDAICDYAFYSTKLKNVAFDDALRSIGKNAFTSSGSLTEVILPDGFETIGAGAFHGCWRITKVDLGGTKTVGGYAFYNNQSLNDLNMRTDLNRLTTIYEGAFTECSAIKEFIFPDSLKTIVGMGMINMPALQKVHIGAGMTGSLSGAFTGDWNLSEITVSEDNPVYHAENNVLYGTMTDTTDAEYPGKHLFLSLPSNTFSEYEVEEGTVVIDAQAFRGNTSLRKVTLPEGLLKLCVGSFNGCSNLSDIAFPDSLEYVDGFYSTTSLNTVDFGTKIKKIEDNAFMGDYPAHIIVRGGQEGAFCDGMDFTGKEGSDTAYFGPGMTSISFEWEATPNITVIPATAQDVSLESPSASDISNFYVYVPSGTDGEEAVKKALKASNISESHIRDYQDLDGTLVVGDPEGSDEGDGDEQVKTYTIGASWYKTGTDEESSVGFYLGSDVYMSYAGAGNYKVTFSPSSVYASMIKSMSFGGVDMERDGGNFFATMTAEQIGTRQAIGFKLNTGSYTMTQSADVAFDQAAVNQMIADVAAGNSGNSANRMELAAASDTASNVVAGGVVTAGKSAKVYVDRSGGVAGDKEYRFIETAPDGSQLIMRDWNAERTYEWYPMRTGYTLTAEVRDATMLRVEAAGVVRAMDATAQESNALLLSLIESASSLDTSAYADDAVATFTAAIADAQAVADRDNATNSELAGACDALAGAQEALLASGELQSVAGSWFKEGTYGTNDEESSMVGSMVESNVRVRELASGGYTIDIDFTESGAQLMDNVAYNGADATKVDDDTWRISVSEAALSKPMTVAFTYTAGRYGQMTHSADLVLDADDLAAATAVATEVSVAWTVDGGHGAAYLNDKAQLRKVGDTWLVDLSTSAPQVVTAMSLAKDAADDTADDTAGVDLGDGVFRISLTQAQLAGAVPMKIFVAEPHNTWMSASITLNADDITAACRASAAKEVQQAMTHLPAAEKVTASDGDAIAAVQAAYAGLGDEDKAKVSDEAKEILSEAGAAYATILMDAVTTSSSEEEIAAARAAYDALGKDSKALVTAASLESLQAGELALAEAKAKEAADKEAAAKAEAELKAKEAAAKAEAEKAKRNAVKNLTLNTKTVSAASVKKAVAAKTGNASYLKYVKTITLGTKVQKVKGSAFAKCTNAKTLVVKSAKLKKASAVKNCLKGSKITKVKVAKKQLSAYKKIFVKKTVGKKVTLAKY